MAAALYFDISVNNFEIQEYMCATPETDEVFPHHYCFKMAICIRVKWPDSAQFENKMERCSIGDFEDLWAMGA